MAIVGRKTGFMKKLGSRDVVRRRSMVRPPESAKADLLYQSHPLPPPKLAIPPKESGGLVSWTWTFTESVSIALVPLSGIARFLTFVKGTVPFAVEVELSAISSSLDLARGCGSTCKVIVGEDSDRGGGELVA